MAQNVRFQSIHEASRRAKRVLQGPYLEAVPKDDGLRHWKFDSMIDPEAFRIVMNIIHAQFSEVPDQISLGMLTNVTVIADDLDCRDSVRHFAKSWLEELNEDIDLNVEYDSISCARNIFISWFFGVKDVLQWACRKAIFWSSNISSSFGLPIPPHVLSEQSLKKISLAKS
jgi:hypothetical protein